MTDREAFEAWWKPHNYGLAPGVEFEKRIAIDAWQAALAHARQQKALAAITRADEDDARQQSEPVSETGPWTADGNDDGTQAWVDSHDFTHDVRLYVNGDFAAGKQRFAYAEEVARRLNAAPVQQSKPVTRSPDAAKFMPHAEWCSLRDPIYTGECDCNVPAPVQQSEPIGDYVPKDGDWYTVKITASWQGGKLLVSDSALYAALPADDEAVRLPRMARDDLQDWTEVESEAPETLKCIVAIDAYLAKRDA